MRLVGFDVEPQVEVVAEGRTYRADFRIVGTRVLVEFDGAVKYGTDRRVLFEEKRREDALRRQGWVVVRIVWDELEDPHLIRRRIVDAVRLAGDA
jgi:very-short-patch-repair endonuclease